MDVSEDSKVEIPKNVSIKNQSRENFYRKTILCQTPGVGFGPTLFRQAPSIAAVMKRTLEEERQRREELDMKVHRRSISDSETAYRVSKPGTDGGLQKCYDEIMRIQNIVEGLKEVKEKLGDTSADDEEKEKIDEAITKLTTIRKDNKEKIKDLVQNFEI